MSHALSFLLLIGVAACGETQISGPVRGHADTAVGHPLPRGVDVARATALGMFDGPSTAPLTVVEVFDFTCPHCSKMHGALAELVHEYNGKVRVVYKNFVLRPARSLALHLAACAAARQGKFQPYAAALWREVDRRQPSEADIEKLVAAGQTALQEALVQSMTAQFVPDAVLIGLARDANLDLEKFEAHRTGTWCRDLVDLDHSELDKRGFDSLPVLLIGNQVVWAITKDDLRTAIDAALARTY